MLLKNAHKLAQKALADKHFKDVHNNHKIITDVLDYYSSLLQKGRLISDAERKKAFADMEDPAKDALWDIIKPASDAAEEIASTVKNKLTKPLAADAKKIGDEAVKIAQDVANAHRQALNDLAKIDTTYYKKISPIASKSSALLMYNPGAAYKSAKAKYDEAVQASSEIEAIKDHEVDPRSKLINT